MTTLPDFQVPTISYEEISDNHGRFTIEPLDKGFGYTYGNSLRRVLLSSLKGAAITSVRIEGVAHEFSTIPGLEGGRHRHRPQPRRRRAHAHGRRRGRDPAGRHGPRRGQRREGHRPARGRRDPQPGRAHRHAEKKTKLEMYLTIGRGRGYSPADENKSDDKPIGVIPIDSIFSPIRRAAYNVDSARVGQRTDFDKLQLEVETGRLDRARRRPARRRRDLRDRRARPSSRRPTGSTSSAARAPRSPRTATAPPAKPPQCREPTGSTRS